MQNRYIADLGDFGKYGLLRNLCGKAESEKGLSLGVLWYLVPDESHNEDGKYISYLNRSRENDLRFRECDEDLYDKLRAIIKSGERNIRQIKNSRVLPEWTIYFEEPLCYDELPILNPETRKKRLRLRNYWVEAGLNKTINCDLIFVDPDNGLQVKSVERHHNKATKYAYYEELLPIIQRGQSLIVYHHLCRNGTASKQIEERLSHIEEYCGIKDSYALLYKRGTLRAFIIVPSEMHKKLLIERSIRTIINWNEHFELIKRG